jgi:hypothetical protein
VFPALSRFWTVFKLKFITIFSSPMIFVPQLMMICKFKISLKRLRVFNEHEHCVSVCILTALSLP